MSSQQRSITIDSIVINGERYTWKGQQGGYQPLALSDDTPMSDARRREILSQTPFGSLILREEDAKRAEGAQ